MPTHPLTHHEIITLVGPFTRQGYHPDLAATNRLERRLVFKPVERSFEARSDAGMCEVLQLESRNSAHRLIRTLTCVTGDDEKLEARLEIEGADLADLLACVGTIEPEQQFRFGPGFRIAKSYRLVRGSGVTPDGAPVVQKVLTKMSGEAAGLMITATAPTVKSDPEAAIEIQPAGGEYYRAVPEDLLAVLGWDWGLIQRRRDSWKSSLRLRGREPDRTKRAEHKLDRMVEHLVQTFTEAPARFHERLVGARWGVVFRRAIPLLLSLALIAGAALTSRLPLADDLPVRMMMMNLPGFLMVFLFCMRKLPVIEIPPIPRRLRAPAWREPAPLAAAS